MDTEIHGWKMFCRCIESLKRALPWAGGGWNSCERWNLAPESSFGFLSFWSYFCRFRSSDLKQNNATQIFVVTFLGFVPVFVSRALLPFVAELYPQAAASPAGIFVFLVCASAWKAKRTIFLLISWSDDFHSDCLPKKHADAFIGVRLFSTMASWKFYRRMIFPGKTGVFQNHNIVY